MKFKWCTLFAVFIFVLLGCGGSDSPSITAPVDSDGDGVNDDLDAYIYDPEKSVLDVTTTINFRAPIIHVLLPNVIILDVNETTLVETFNNGDVKTAITTTYTSLDSITFGETTVSDWLHSDSTFSRINKWSNDFNLDGQTQFYGKSLDLGIRTNDGEIFWGYLDEDDAVVEGGNNGNSGRIFHDVDFTARIHLEDLSEIDAVSLVTRTWKKDDKKYIVTTDFYEYKPDEFELVDNEALDPSYAQNTVEEIVTSKLIAVSHRKDWAADGTFNESSQFTINGENAYIYSYQRPIWANPNDGIDEEYADWNWAPGNNDVLTSYWYETTYTVTGGVFNGVGKRFILDMGAAVKLVNSENPNGFLFHEWESTKTSVHETETNDYVTWTHYALDGYEFTNTEEQPGQAYKVGEKQGNDIWVEYSFAEWGSQSVEDLAEQVETLRAGGAGFLDIDEQMIPGLSSYARLGLTPSFIYDAAGEERIWYLVSIDADFSDNGLYSINTVTLTNNGLKDGWLVLSAPDVIVLAKPLVDEPWDWYNAYERDWLSIFSIDLQLSHFMWVSNIGEFYLDEAQAQTRLIELNLP